MCVIGLEVSTSSVKAVLYSATGEEIGEYTKPLTPDVAHVTWQNPEGIFAIILNCLRKVASFAQDPYTIQAIGLGGIWHSLLLLDDQRKPLEPIRTWADLSSSEILNSEKARELSSLVYKKTGCLRHGMYPFWKLYAMKEQEFCPLKKVRYLSSQIEYIFESLTEEVAVSACTASGSGLLNIHTKKWDQDLLDLLGVNLGMLPKVEEIYYVAPLKQELSRYVGLKSGIPVTIGCPDGALNQIGSGALANGIMTFSVGTSGALRLTGSEPLFARNLSTWCYYLLDDIFLVGAATHATSNLEWFMNRFGLEQIGHYSLAQAAGELEIDEGPLFLPFLYGERAPGWRDNRMGGFAALQGKHTTTHLYKAVLEGILFALFHSYLELTKVVLEPTSIRISGGIMNSPFWLQMAADIFGREITCTSYVNESTLGAGLLALQVSGQLESISDFSPPFLKTITPDYNKHDLYLERFTHYLEKYQQQ